MKKLIIPVTGCLVLAACGGAEQPTEVAATTDVAAIDFGDDNGEWANDGECDDPRFEGPGMTATILLDEDRWHDATDCRTAYEAGNLQLKAGESTVSLMAAPAPAAAPAPQPTKVAAPQPVATVTQTAIDFGDDASQWSNDGECDDPRFEGSGMTNTPLLVEDIRHDASDCRAAYEAGKLRLR